MLKKQFKTGGGGGGDVKLSLEKKDDIKFPNSTLSRTRKYHKNPKIQPATLPKGQKTL